MDELISTPTVGLVTARQAIDEAIRRAVSMEIRVCIAVTDTGGQLVSYDRMNGAPLMCGQIAQDKAYTVSTFGRPTHEWWSMISNDPALRHGVITVDRVVVYGGGVPIMNGDTVVGAIGVSGGSCDQDRIIAEAGAAAAAKMLPLNSDRETAASGARISDRA